MEVGGRLGVGVAAVAVDLGAVLVRLTGKPRVDVRKLRL